jgi:outer membrane biosynthesis protein TonB
MGLRLFCTFSIVCSGCVTAPPVPPAPTMETRVVLPSGEMSKTKISGPSETDFRRSVQQSNQQKAQIEQCYNLSLEKSPHRQGTVSIQFTLAVNGTVSNALVESDTIKDEVLNACLCRTIDSWIFPGLIEEETDFIYPFVFVAAQQVEPKH